MFHLQICWIDDRIVARWVQNMLEEPTIQTIPAISECLSQPAVLDTGARPTTPGQFGTGPLPTNIYGWRSKTVNLLAMASKK